MAKIEVKTTIEKTAHFHDGEFKTKPCELHTWYGDHVCLAVNLNDEIKQLNFPEGEYKITITLEKINE